MTSQTEVGAPKPVPQSQMTSQSTWLEFFLKMIEPTIETWLGGYPKLVVMLRTIGYVMLICKHLPLQARSLWSWLKKRLLTPIAVFHNNQGLYNSFNEFVLQNACYKSTSLSASQTSVTHINGSSVVSSVGFETRVNFAIVYQGTNTFFFLDGDHMATLWCLGSATIPLRNLLRANHTEYVRKEQSKQVTVMVPEPDKDGKFSWTKKPGAARRSMDSICLPAKMKDNILSVVDTYLDPSYADFCADFGAPRRLGFLLHGKPGCGKTSFAIALATKYNLKVHLISLTAPGMNDKVLQELVRGLGEGCLMLIEDIDSAGIQRESGTFATKMHDAKRQTQRSSRKCRKRKNKHAKEAGDKVRKASSEEDDSSEEEPEDQKQELPPKACVTLSGLLNAIDGLLAPTGHIFMATTNHKERLDAALFRKGRCDYNMEFPYAGFEQIDQMFQRLYRPICSTAKARYDYRRVPQLAKQFASMIPEDTFPVADIQQYLFTQKMDPQDAFDNIADLIGKGETNRVPNAGPKENIRDSSASRLGASEPLDDLLIELDYEMGTPVPPPTGPHIMSFICDEQQRSHPTLLDLQQGPSQAIEGGFEQIKAHLSGKRFEAHKLPIRLMRKITLLWPFAQPELGSQLHKLDRQPKLESAVHTQAEGQTDTTASDGSLTTAVPAELWAEFISRACNDADPVSRSRWTSTISLIALRVMWNARKKSSSEH